MIILVGFALELVVKFVAGAASCSNEVRKERWQRLEHCILQTGNGKSDQRLEDKGKRGIYTRFLVDGCIPHFALRGAGEGFEGDFVLDGRGRARLS